MATAEKGRGQPPADRRESRREFLRGTLALGTTTAAMGSLATTHAWAHPPHGDRRARPRAGAVSLWVSPRGDDANPGTRHRPFRTLARAQQAVQAADASANVTVHLDGGIHELDEPLIFTPEDAGTGRWVTFRAVEGERPVISGGRVLTGWELHDPDRDIWRVFVGADDTRQLWVEGRRAIRARSASLPSGFEITETGYRYTGADFDFARWRNLRHVEVVSFRRWRSFRCRIASVRETADGVEIEMQNPSWRLSYEFHHPWGNITVPVWIENAYELLDEEGEWYLDRSSGWLCYKPRADEDLRTATTVIGRLERLVDIRGDLDHPVRNLHFEGLSFSYATWLGPNSEFGFSVIQAGYHRTSADQSENAGAVQVPAHVTVRAAERVRFHRCRFEHLGGSALELEYGTKHAVVEGNRFEDVSANAIQVSGIERIHHHPDDDRAVVRDNRIANNLIADVATEYHSCVGIWVGYADGTIIEHNTLFDLPYTAISVGWGWGTTDPGGSAGYTTPTTARNTRICDNHIHHFTQRLIDGGGIYTLSAQPGSVIRGNYIHDQVINHYDDSLVYLDEATRYYRVEDNVLCSTPRWWLKIWTSSIRDNQIVRNYVDRPDGVWNDGVDNVIDDTVALRVDRIPGRARSIAARAGLEPEYRDLLPDGAAGPPPVGEVCDPTYVGEPPLGPPWTP